MMTGRGRARLGGADPANTRRQASPVTDSIAEYETRIAHQRADKDTRFRASPHSPIPPSGRIAFEGLTYFPMDPAARFEGLRLSRPAEDLPTSFDIPTSDGGSRRAQRLGALRFVWNGQDRDLIAYDLGTAHGALFVPFLDATSGSDTYGAGRYLDVEPEEDGTYTLDFNLAYHPFCAYSPDYSCPLTPAENRLPERMEAGERLPVADPR